MSRWIFGYGSLIWRPDFPFAERHRAVADGWARRFWQTSTDHRGTPGAPGRVATMLPMPGERCVGVALLIAPADETRVLADLDHREQQGYLRIDLDVTLDDGRAVRALTYVAPRENRYFAGEEPAAQIAAIVRGAHGPSGANLDYARKLAAALAELDAHDAQLDEILQLV